jgi:hypothetical protein
MVADTHLSVSPALSFYATSVSNISTVVIETPWGEIVTSS